MRILLGCVPPLFVGRPLCHGMETTNPAGTTARHRATATKSPSCPRRRQRRNSPTHSAEILEDFLPFFAITFALCPEKDP